MKSFWKLEWINALRSGKYKQGKTALRRSNKKQKNKAEFCCLGVLCDVAGVKWDKNGTGDDLCLFGNGLLVEDALKFFGLTAEAQETLVRLNDEGGYTFLEIAGYIEKNL